ncbi:MAG TPA: hypothetical protein VEV84_03285, partial [Pyrinomonadaceae bacterium]|nr:hypothetical protein [Pyrinomonadaceae bacterium]
MYKHSDKIKTWYADGVLAWVLIPSVCACTVILPMLIGGLHSSSDMEMYLRFSQEYHQAFATGTLFPGWA